MGFKNWCSQAKIHLGVDFNTLLESSTYRDEDNVLRALRGLEMDVDDDETWKMITLYRCFYFWWIHVLGSYSLGVSKADVKTHQKMIKDAIEGDSARPRVPPTEHSLLPRLRHPLPTAESSPVIECIISRRQQGAEGLWTVLLQGLTEETEFVERNTPWLIVGTNGGKCLEYILKHGTGPPAPTTLQAKASLKRKHGCHQDTASDSDDSEQSSRKPTNSDSDSEPSSKPKLRRKRRRQTPIYSSSESESESSSKRQSKTKRKKPNLAAREEEPNTKEPLFLPSDGDGSDQDEYEVEEIVGWHEENNSIEWLVHWKGFDAAEDSWLNLEQLEGAHMLLHAFNLENGLSLPTGSTPSFPRFTPTPTPSSDDDYVVPKPSTARARNLARQLEAEGEDGWEPNREGLNTEFIETLLNSMVLSHERSDLQVTASMLERKQNIRLAGTDSSREIAGRIVDQIEVHNDLSTWMYFELPNVAAGTWGSRLAKLTLECVANIGMSIPSLISLGQIQDLISRGICSQVCCSLVAVYQWLVHLGPSLASHLITVHQQSDVDVLRKDFPDLAPMIEHVLGFVQEERVWRERTRSAKSKKGRGRKPARKIGRPATVNVSEVNEVEEAEVPAQKPSTYTREPADLWGLRPSTKGTIALPVLRATTKLNTDKEMGQVAAATLCQLWDDNLILDPMRIVDEYFDQHRITKSPSALMDICYRCITRGAILQCLADAFGDGIFACSAMQTFLIQPSRLFTSRIAHNKHFACAVERDEYETLRALDQHLTAVLAADPSVRDTCIEIAELVHRGLLSLELGYSITDEEYENPYTFLTAEHSLTLLSVSNSKKGKTRPRKPLADTRPRLETLLPHKPQFGVAAIIVREALSERRNKPATAETTIFRRLLTAHHPSTGAPTRYDHDQMDPICADLQSFKWLTVLIPSDKLRTGLGLSSLLVYMGTGQGSGTIEFLAHMDQRVGKMFFQSLEEAVEVFTVMENLSEANQLKYKNPSVYGQVNVWYSLRPKFSLRGQYVELDIREKLGPYFEEELHANWVALVGPDAPKPDWEDILRWILQAELRGFSSGLGALQFANNIVLIGIANPPSPAAMAQWIYLNKGFGAFAGLIALGFKLPDNASPATVRTTFFCFYKWFEAFMTDEDKEIVRFGTIFAEQELCKIERWKNRLQTMGKTDLSAMAKVLFEGQVWTKSANLKDHTRWPIPSAEEFPLSIFKSIVDEGGTELNLDEDEPDGDLMDVDV
ncbi:hypothetical protein C8F04DRAFT_1262079 [Mycena alexandri]|uniref:Chromo domain-containing protein n=1 Tax=Mycena alexandri TaxID=1745969 RepID=A0AAD6SQQ0_9AGAR|nr:hypothetical protein C8F04DRAFT_1262079 [Mycena alexandri]